MAKAAAKNEPVKQDIAVTVTADKIECAINGTVVGSYTKVDLVAAGKRKSTDGVFGLRIAHNTEASVSNFKMTKRKGRKREVRSQPEQGLLTSYFFLLTSGAC